MLTSKAPFELQYFRGHEWGEPPPQMIQHLIVGTLDHAGVFRSVLTPPDSARGAYVLRITLSELVQDYAPSPPIARVRFRAELLGPSGQSVASRDVGADERMQESTADAGVIATNSAMSNALATVAAFVTEHAR